MAAPRAPTSPEEAPRPPTSPEEAAKGRRLEGRAPAKPLLVLGVGNPDSRTDAAGRELARRLAARLAAGGAGGVGKEGAEPGPVTLRECNGSAFEILDAWEGFDRVILVDACLGADGSTTGRDAADGVLRFDVRKAPLPAHLGSTSSHGWGVAEAVELARALGRLPAAVEVWAVPVPEPVAGGGAG